jgi:DsbC/DsbD-like thiol-disulfide interchange protein
MNRRRLMALTLAAVAAPAAARAGIHYKVALISGGEANGEWRAGLEIVLDPGWKTYWRMPGNAGIPPEFNWSRSENLDRVDVSWPAPRRYHDAGGETVGYHDRVVFPLRVRARTPEKPVKLVLELFFAVCKDICIPVTASSVLAQTAASTPAEADLIAAFAKQVPVPVNHASPARVTHAGVIDIAGKPALSLTFARDIWSEGLDIFVEGGGLAYFRAPQRGGANREVYLPVDGIKTPHDLRGQTLRLTLVSGETPLEQSVTVA